MKKFMRLVTNSRVEKFKDLWKEHENDFQARLNLVKNSTQFGILMKKLKQGV